ncbi:MAG: hypothetical protein LBO79_06545 [Zoogloeaceae bacterium]|nr:hypothetical protein [Zoogloeaceae bacterium]
MRKTGKDQGSHFNPRPLALALAAAFSAQAGAQELEISQTPQALGGGQSANLMILIDNAGNTTWGHAPRNADRYTLASGDGGAALYHPDYNNLPYRSSSVNLIYYDPMSKYDPPRGPDGKFWGPIDFHNAPRDGYGVIPKGTVKSDLATAYVDTWYLGLDDFTNNEIRCLGWNSGRTTTYWHEGKFYCGDYSRTQPAYYARYDTARPGCLAQYDAGDEKGPRDILGFGGGDLSRRQPGIDYGNISGDNNDNIRRVNLDAFRNGCFEKIVVGSPQDRDEYNHPANRETANCDAACAAGKKKQNFANWYSYYRTKLGTVKTVMSQVAQEISPGVRVGFAVTGPGGGFTSKGYYGTSQTQYRNGDATAKIDELSYSLPSIHRGVRPFADFAANDPSAPLDYRGQKFKSGFFDWLFSMTSNGSGTTQPNTKRALGAVGAYYADGRDMGPWSTWPGSTTGKVQLCRKSYALLISAGEYDTGANASSIIFNGVQYGPKGNEDNKEGASVTLPNGKAHNTYTPADPFRDGYGNTLADVANYYWKTPLGALGSPITDKTQFTKVPATVLDPAVWPHMNTLILNVGGFHDIDPDVVVDVAAKGEKLPEGKGYDHSDDWGDPSKADPENTPRSFLYVNDMIHAALNGRGGFYSFRNTQDLADTLNKAVGYITNDNLTLGVNATNTASSRHPTLYQASFSASNWTGRLRAYKLCTGMEVWRDRNIATKNTDSACKATGDTWKKPAWDASEILPRQGARVIFTASRSDGGIVQTTPFEWEKLGADERVALGGGAASGKDIVAYLRGDDSGEGSVFRARNKRILGDIVDGGLLYVGNDDFGFANSPAVGAGARAAYRKRKNTNADRTEMVFAAANDGMLHAFNAEPDPATPCAACATPDALAPAPRRGGEEIFAYIPRSVLPKLKKLTDVRYGHEFFVNGMPVAGDVYFPVGGTSSGDAWRTVVVGATGAGGRGIYALDVEDPENPEVLWERSGGVKIAEAAASAPAEDGDIWVKGFAPDAGYENLGFTIGSPSIAHLRLEGSESMWTVIYGNGYGSENGKASLFVTNARNGEKLVEYRPALPNDGAANGLSTPIVVDVNKDGVADLAYAGDLRGNLWKFNLGPACVKSVTADPSSPKCMQKILTAKDRGGVNKNGAKPQAITAQPEVAYSPMGGGLMVYVGTGRFFAEGDKKDKQVQTFYGVHDKCVTNTESCAVGPFSRESATMHEQVIEAEKTLAYHGASGKVGDMVVEVVRVIRDDGRNPDPSDDGFFMDLVVHGEPGAGERVIARPIVWNDRLIINTIQPGDDECSPRNTGWLYEVNRFSGARLDFSVFDLDGNSQFGNPSDERSASGVQVGMGGGVMTRGANKYLHNAGGGVRKISQNPRGSVFGRRSWWQIR